VTKILSSSKLHNGIICRCQISSGIFMLLCFVSPHVKYTSVSSRDCRFVCQMSCVLQGILPEKQLSVEKDSYLISSSVHFDIL
jgi:hypothetical protein